MKPEMPTSQQTAFEPARERKAYTAPTLTLFGQVAQLTQQGTCNESNDNATGACSVNTGMGMATSDPRLKTRIVRVGDHPLGFGLYLFEYRPEYSARLGSGRHFGVMADEVRPLVPEAVLVGDDGFLRVDYQRLGIRSHVH